MMKSSKQCFYFLGFISKTPFESLLRPHFGWYFEKETLSRHFGSIQLTFLCFFYTQQLCFQPKISCESSSASLLSVVSEVIGHKMSLCPSLQQIKLIHTTYASFLNRDKLYLTPMLMRDENCRDARDLKSVFRALSILTRLLLHHCSKSKCTNSTTIFCQFFSEPFLHALSLIQKS